MKKLIKIATVMPVLLALLLAGCSLDDPSDPTGDVNPPGPADAGAAYVAIGNSLTAGYMDAGLMKAGQANSYPFLMATQMGLSKETFTQPWIDAPGIGSTKVAPDHTSGVLRYNGVQPVPLGTTLTEDIRTKGTLLLARAQLTPYHNLGVPGARLDELLATHNSATSVGSPLGTKNAFFDFILRSSFFGNISVPAAPPVPAYETASIFGQAVAKGPALTTVFIGGNDYLFGALSGQPIDNAALITESSVWGPNYGQFLGTYAGALNKRNGFKPDIIVATLPLIENIPYFLDIVDFTPVFGPWNTTETNVKYVLITDFLAWFQTHPGGTMPKEMTLDEDEVNFLNSVIGAYNGAIQVTIVSPQIAPLANFGLVDFNKAFEAEDAEATQHFLFLRAKYGTGTATDEPIADTAARTLFSIDGVHPNNRGYAFAANEFLKVINDLTGSSYAEIPLAAVTWDPTYGVPTVKTTAGQWPVLSPEVARSFKEIFR